MATLWWRQVVWLQSIKLEKLAAEICESKRCDGYKWCSIIWKKWYWWTRYEARVYWSSPRDENTRSRGGGRVAIMRTCFIFTIWSTASITWHACLQVNCFDLRECEIRNLLIRYRCDKLGERNPITWPITRPILANQETQSDCYIRNFTVQLS